MTGRNAHAVVRDRHARGAGEQLSDVSKHAASHRQDAVRIRGGVCHGCLAEIYARAFEKQWFYDNKPHGFDIQDQRMGALIYRADSCRRRILDYVSGKIDRIDELDEVLLVSGNPEESVSIKSLPLSSTVNLPFHRSVVAPF